LSVLKAVDLPRPYAFGSNVCQISKLGSQWVNGPARQGWQKMSQGKDPRIVIRVAIGGYAFDRHRHLGALSDEGPGVMTVIVEYPNLKRTSSIHLVHDVIHSSETNS
jgi:hypothetical protein